MLASIRTTLGATAFAMALLATPVLAQVSMTAVAHTDLYAHAGETSTIRAGTELTNHSISRSSPPLDPYGHASLQVDVLASQVSFQTSAFGFASANGDIMITLSSPTPTAGSLHFDVQTTGVSYLVEFDVGNDGNWEQEDGITTAAAPVLIDSSGIQVLIRLGSSAGAFGGSDASSSITMTFVRNGMIVPVGNSCGPDLSATYARWPDNTVPEQHITFTASAPPGTPIAAIVLGFSDPAQILPNGICTQHVDLIAIVWVTLDPQGKATYVLNIPPWINAFELRAQFGIDTSGNIGTGNPAVNIRLSEGLHFQIPAH